MVYLPYDPKNDELYECKVVSIGDILSTVWKYSEIFNDKNSNSFGKWCKSKNVNFLLSKPKRKLNDHGKKSLLRSLYVLKEDCLGKLKKIALVSSLFILLLKISHINTIYRLYS